MRILGIDYGKRKIGVALANEFLAEPYKQIRYEKIEEALAKIKQIVESQKVEKVVLGISEEKMARKTKKFARLLQSSLNLKVYFQDETLSTFEAKEIARKLKISRKKIKNFEDAVAAAIILQNYLDLHRLD